MNIHDPYGDLYFWTKLSNAVAVLDIGAHQGDTIIRFLDELKIPIHAFEPTPESFTLLESRFRKTSQVHLHNIALGNKTGDENFFVNNNKETNSLLDNDKGNNEGYAEYTQHKEIITVKVETLDKWLAANDILGPIVVKADIQGAEKMLIEGGVNAFQNQVVAFYSEVQIEKMYKGQADFSILNETMKKNGFSLVEIYPCMKDRLGRAVQTDALWIKKRLVT
jgi:FkbM family methyltransferase